MAMLLLVFAVAALLVAAVVYGSARRGARETTMRHARAILAGSRDRRDGAEARRVRAEQLDRHVLEVRLVGNRFDDEDFAARQVIIAGCVEGEALLLERDRIQSHGGTAIRVLRASTREQIGYVSREDSEILAPILDAGKVLVTRISALPEGVAGGPPRGMILEVNLAP